MDRKINLNRKIKLMMAVPQLELGPESRSGLRFSPKLS